MSKEDPRKSAKFARVTRLLWNDPRFSKMSDDAQLLFFYLWTGPRRTLAHISGSCSVPALAFDRRWTEDRTRNALNELCADFVDFDAEAGMVAVKAGFDLDPPDNGSVVQAWAGVLADLPASWVVDRHLGRLREYCAHRGEDWRTGFAKLTAALPLRFVEGHGVRHGVGHGAGHHKTDPGHTHGQQQQPARAREAAPGVSAAAREEEIAKLTAQGMTRAEAVAQVDASPAAADATQPERASA